VVLLRLKIYFINSLGLSLDLLVPNFSKFNSKLLKEEDISRALFQAYRMASEDPHDDRADLSNQVEQKEENRAVYDFEEEDEQINVDSRDEKMEEEIIPALNERSEEEEEGEDQGQNDDQFFGV